MIFLDQPGLLVRNASRNAPQSHSRSHGATRLLHVAIARDDRCAQPARIWRSTVRVKKVRHHHPSLNQSGLNGVRDTAGISRFLSSGTALLVAARTSGSNLTTSLLRRINGRREKASTCSSPHLRNSHVDDKRGVERDYTQPCVLDVRTIPDAVADGRLATCRRTDGGHGLAGHGDAICRRQWFRIARWSLV